MDQTRLDFTELFGMTGVRRFTASAVDHGVVKTIVALLVGINDWFFHPTHTPVEVVMVLVLFDTITGFMKAYKQNNVSSSGFFRFASKIVIYFILMATGALLDKLAEGFAVKALTLIASFLAMTEAISIMENIGALGFAIPSQLMKLLKLAKDGSTKSDKDKPSS